MRFGILGPLRVGGTEDGTVTAGRDRVVLAMLLLNAGRVVSVDRLMAAMWDGAPPNTARGQLQTCVSRLRRSLAVTVGDEVIVTDPAGYSARIAPDDLDAAVFSTLTAQARAAADGDRLEAARDAYRAALKLWRGPALSGIASRAVQRGAAALDEQQAVAIEECVEVELRLGRERELLGELTDLAERYPLRERLRTQLMLALYRAGRQADALAVYREARTVLAEDLGIEPGPALREMHQRILVGDVGVPGDERRSHPPARCLPRTAADFTGRNDVVARLVEAVERADPSGPVIQLIDGMAGSGKTTLAVHVATLLSGRYPDAQLFVDLHGHSERRPLEPSAALVTLLRQLGVPSERIPPSPDERVALWRTELAARRVLVVLDNAGSTAQVGPLLPAAPGCLALVTSRAGSWGWTAYTRSHCRCSPSRKRSSCSPGWPGRSGSRPSRRPRSRWCAVVGTCRWPSASPGPGWPTGVAGEWPTWPPGCAGSVRCCPSSPPRTARWRVRSRCRTGSCPSRPSACSGCSGSTRARGSTRLARPRSPTFRWPRPRTISTSLSTGTWWRSRARGGSGCTTSCASTPGSLSAPPSRRPPARPPSGGRSTGRCTPSRAPRPSWSGAAARLAQPAPADAPRPGGAVRRQRLGVAGGAAAQPAGARTVRGRDRPPRVRVEARPRHVAVPVHPLLRRRPARHPARRPGGGAALGRRRRGGDDAQLPRVRVLPGGRVPRSDRARRGGPAAA
ncbi:BTAD domain-containing putative transcriptional regulator [Phytohabitans flavus]|uniref:AfsR/SARP family transcriptional regulator n=1 Tax=Phytohabitans flavus TaxID=1076124 RepID=UPI00363EEEF8